MDLSSNQITDVGVTAIVNSFRDVQTTALSMLDISFVPCSVPPCEIVLSTVILIGNHDISQNSFDSLQREVRNAGLLMSFRYSSPVDLQAPTPPRYLIAVFRMSFYMYCVFIRNILSSL